MHVFDGWGGLPWGKLRGWSDLRGWTVQMLRCNPFLFRRGKLQHLECLLVWQQHLGADLYCTTILWCYGVRGVRGSLCAVQRRLHRSTNEHDELRGGKRVFACGDGLHILASLLRGQVHLGLPASEAWHPSSGTLGNLLVS